MSEYTPECAKLHHLKIIFAEHALSNVFQDQEISNSLKNNTPMTSLNMKLRSCPRVIYELDISVQAMQLFITFLANNVLIFTLLMCYY